MCGKKLKLLVELNNCCGFGYINDYDFIIRKAELLKKRTDVKNITIKELD